MRFLAPAEKITNSIKINGGLCRERVSYEEGPEKRPSWKPHSSHPLPSFSHPDKHESSFWCSDLWVCLLFTAQLLRSTCGGLLHNGSGLLSESERGEHRLYHTSTVACSAFDLLQVWSIFVFLCCPTRKQKKGGRKKTVCLGASEKINGIWLPLHTICNIVTAACVFVLGTVGGRWYT